MSETARFLAFDLGAESGRGVLGTLDGRRLKLQEIHRFANGPVRVLNSLHWDVLKMQEEIKHALELCVREYSSELAGIGFDTWGVDFALIG